MEASRPEYLSNLAFLYLALAYGTDDYLSDAELGAIIEKLQDRFPDTGPAALQTVVAKAMAQLMETDDMYGAVERAAYSLADHLSEEQQRAVLDELAYIAEADGVVLHRERTMLRRLSAQWHALMPDVKAASLDVSDRQDEGWSVLHDLAFLYLVLAHGTDDDLSIAEVQVIITKLQEWQPRLDSDDVQEVLDRAIDRYVGEPDEEALAASVRALRAELPEEQRMAALNDLVQIANADGVFLDDEEDMINDLMDAWEVAAYSSYGNQGTKNPEP